MLRFFRYLKFIYIVAERAAVFIGFTAESMNFLVLASFINFIPLTF